MSKIKLFCILALMVLVAVPAYAEVQNVKVSGDLAARWIIRDTYDLDKNNNDTSNAADDYLMSSAEVQVDADLTDNVSTVVRLVNQRDWNDTSAGETLSTAATQFDVLVDLANVTLKEFVYSPLTLTIGRQDLWFGKGFVVGAKQRDPNNSITAHEYTVINSFDAIKATLDFDPWKLDAIYSIIEENTVNRADDVWLAGVNVGYKFDSYNGEAEAYYFMNKDNSQLCYYNNASNRACEDNSINVLGLRGSFEPIANASISAEGAVQHGRYSVQTSEARSRSAYALDIAGDYLFRDVKWTPKVGIEYIIYSGEETTGGGDNGNRYEAWDPFYRGKFDSAIREFQNTYYATAMRANNAASMTSLDMDAGTTNQTQFILMGTVKPTNTLTLDGRFAWFRMLESQAATSDTTSGRPKEIGTELDLSLTYDYTEDVSFGLLTAWFFPGKYWLSGQDDTATDIVGTVKVAF